MPPDPDPDDPERWPLLTLDHLGVLDRWRVLDHLTQRGFARCAYATEALLRLWRRGRKTDAEMLERRPMFPQAPPWVDELLRDADWRGEDPLRVLADEERVRAAEAVALLRGTAGP